MKKHLRGKRYIRSRASVQIGRQKRFVHKFNRGLAAMKRIDFDAIILNAVGALNEMVERINSVFRIPHHLIDITNNRTL